MSNYHPILKEQRITHAYYSPRPNFLCLFPFWDFSKNCLCFIIYNFFFLISKSLFNKIIWDLSNKIYIKYKKYYKLKDIDNFLRSPKKETGTTNWNGGSMFFLLLSEKVERKTNPANKYYDTPYMYFLQGLLSFFLWQTS